MIFTQIIMASQREKHLNLCYTVFLLTIIFIILLMLFNLGVEFSKCFNLQIYNSRTIKIFRVKGLNINEPKLCFFN